MKAIHILTIALSVMVSGCTKKDSPVAPTTTDPVAIQIGALPDGIQGRNYGQHTLTATGGDGIYTWSVVQGSGAMPSGLTLSASGTISGTPTSVGSHAFSVSASSGSESAQRAFSIEVIPLLEVLTASLPDGVRDADYGVISLEAAGGTGTYNWWLDAGALPAGINLDASGTLSGAPTEVGAYSFTLGVAAEYQRAERAFSITVEAPPEQSRIVFVRNTATGYQIFAMDEDGGNVAQLTTNLLGSTNIHPDLSPDGSKVAFISNSGGPGSEIHVMNADGTNVVNVSNRDGNQLYPAWSPDGSKITYKTDEIGYYNDDLWVMNADGTDPQRLTFDEVTDETQPAWSPDGSKIAFVWTIAADDRDIYVMNADGSNPVNLTNNSDVELDPTWSPDGSKIAYQSGGDIMVMDADGTNVVNVTNSAVAEYGPTWSPDGTKLAFTSWIDTLSDIFVINIDGTNRVRLTTDPASDSQPSWSR